MKLYHESDDAFYKALQECRNGEKKIINGWDCTFLPDEVIEVVTKYDSYEKLLEDIRQCPWIQKFRYYDFHGFRTGIYSSPSGGMYAWIEHGRVPDAFYNTALIKVN